MVRTQRRAQRQQRLFYHLLTWWNLTLAASNVLHFAGGAGLGYGLALVVHVGCGLYALGQLWRMRRARHL
jgi:hypothetical protein